MVSIDGDDLLSVPGKFLEKPEEPVMSEMPDVPDAADGGSSLERLLGSIMHGGLPQILAGPAGKALSQLIGAAVAVPATWLESRVLVAKETNKARAEMMRALAKEATRRAVKDEALVARTLDTLMAGALAKQEAREDIAVRAVALLQDQPPPKDGASPDPDWMNMFIGYAENASTARLRETWARVLKEEVSKPGSMSRRSIQFISTLDAEVAQSFERIAAYVLLDWIVPGPERFFFNQQYDDVLLLKEYGLINDDVSHKCKASANGILALQSRSHLISMVLAPHKEVRIKTMTLTRVGQEIHTLLDAQDTIEIMRDSAERLAKEVGVAKAEIFSRDPKTGNVDRRSKPIIVEVAAVGEMKVATPEAPPEAGRRKRPSTDAVSRKPAPKPRGQPSLTPDEQQR